MGYNSYFYLMSKKVTRKIQKLNTLNEFYKFVAQSKNVKEEARKRAVKILSENEASWFDITNLGEEIHDFGKLYGDELYEAITTGGKPLFKKNSELDEEFEYHNALIVGKEALKQAALTYLNKTVKSYEELLKTPEQLKKKEEWRLFTDERSVEDKLKTYVEEKLFYLRKSNKPLDFDENKKYKLTNAWLYEYNMFELVHQYKTIDFNKYDIVEFGW